MITFKCKMCGGDLHPEENATICECEYCGSMQTIPTADNEKKGNLFNRANRLRMAAEYDKAAAVYTSITAEFPEEAEAYWGLCLCKYGIEYVEDPVTAKKIPTCHRTRSDSIMDDPDFDQACENADAIAKRVYREEAKAIDRLQRDILSVVANESPYDVFICYKETDDNGERTEDSVLAQDIYDALTAKGLKVFFARITLEDKLGQQYEPYIYAALHSAKVMLSIGTQYEYFDAVWVKNEWTRFLDMMKSDKSKTLIPCFKEIDAYDMPREFKNLQAQDMGKLGWLQDLTRGVLKLCGKEEPTQQITTTFVPADNAVPLVKRAFISLEDGDFAKADNLCEQALNLDPENARAYMGKLMVEVQVHNEAELRNQNKPFDGSKNYEKILRFGDEALKAQVQEDIAFIKRRIEQSRQQTIYEKAVEALGHAATIEEFKKAKMLFESIPDYDGVMTKLADCEARLEQLENETAMREATKKKVLAFKEKAAKVRRDYDVQLQAYRNAENAMKDLERDIATIQQRNEQTKTELSNREAELQNLRGLFSGKRRRELETTISRMRDKMKHDESKLTELCKARESAAAAMPELPQEPADLSSEQEVSYRCAGVYLEARQYDLACLEYGQILGYKDAETQCIETLPGFLAIFPKLNESGITLMALALLRKIAKKNRKACKEALSKLECEMALYAAKISAGYFHIVGLNADGTVVAVGDNENGQCNTGDWKDIVAVTAGGVQTVGLKADGTIVAVGENNFSLFDTGSWKDIVAIAPEIGHIVCLKHDGTVIEMGEGGGECKTGGWRNIVAVATGSMHTIGLKADGTVVAAGDNGNGQCDTEDWKDIVEVSAGSMHTIGLKADGTVVAVGGDNENGQCDTSDWTNIVAVSAGGFHTVGLRADGTVVAVGDNENGQCDTGDWTDIVAVAAGALYTVGLKSDGTVVVVGGIDKNVQNEIHNWKLWK